MQSNIDISFPAEFMMVFGGKDKAKARTQKVEMISLNKDVQVPNCLQDMNDMFPTKFAAGARFSLVESGL